MTYRPSDRELYDAVVAIQGELEAFLVPDKYGFSHNASMWADTAERFLEHVAQELEARNEGRVP